MYLKVPDRTVGDQNRPTTLEEVRAFLAGENVEVDMDLRYPSVEFPDGATYAEYRRIQQKLEEAGFAAY